MRVEILDMEPYMRDTTFVLIHVDVGNMPPKIASKQMQKVRESSLGQFLDGLGFKYGVVPSRCNNSSVTVEIQEISQEDNVQVQNEPDLNVVAPEFETSTESFQPTKIK